MLADAVAHEREAWVAAGVRPGAALADIGCLRNEVTFTRPVQMDRLRADALLGLGSLSRESGPE